MVKWKQSVRGDFFFENNLLLQSDVVFDSESNGRNFSSLAPPGGEKKIIFDFFFKMTSRVGVGVFSSFFELKWKPKKSTTTFIFGARSDDLSVF